MTLLLNNTKFVILKDFEDTILAPFLSRNSVAAVFQEDKLLKNYCALIKVDFKKAIDLKSDVSKKLNARLRQFKKRHCKNINSTIVDIEKNTLALLKTQRSPKGKSLNLKQDDLKQIVQKIDLNVKNIDFDNTTENLRQTLHFGIKMQQNLDWHLEDYSHALMGNPEMEEKCVYVDHLGKKTVQTRKRKEFKSIEIKGYIDELLEKFKSTSSKSKKIEIDEDLDVFTRFYKFYKTFEKEELFVYTSGAEARFNTQKAINGAIINEKEMIEIGVVKPNIIEDDKQNEIPDAMKDLYKSSKEKTKVFKIIND